MLSAALNVNAMLWRTSPAATELEQVGHSIGCGRCLVALASFWSSSTTRPLRVHSTLLAAAREAIPGLHIRQEGMSGRAEVPRLRYYASQEAHSSVDKAGIVLVLVRRDCAKLGG